VSLPRDPMVDITRAPQKLPFDVAAIRGAVSRTRDLEIAGLDTEAHTRVPDVHVGGTAVQQVSDGPSVRLTKITSPEARPSSDADQSSTHIDERHYV